MNFNFKCSLCKKETDSDVKFTVESTEWESPTLGGYGGIDEEDVCKSCNDEVIKKIESMRK